MALVFGKASFAPVVAIVRGFENSILIVPVAENVSGNVVGIDILRVLQPFVVEDFLSYGGLARPVGSGNHYQNRLVLTCDHCEDRLFYLPNARSSAAALPW